MLIDGRTTFGESLKDHNKVQPKIHDLLPLGSNPKTTLKLFLLYCLDIPFYVDP